MSAIDPQRYRSTMGLCLGFHDGLSSGIAVVACRRDDPARTLYLVHEWEEELINVDHIAEALLHARKEFHTVFTCGYYGGRDDNTVFRTLSVRLGQHIEPAPGDPSAPMQLLIDDLRTGRLKTRPDALVVRDAKRALWRSGKPDQTGMLAALRCAHWAAQQYRQRLKKAKTGSEKTADMVSARRRRVERPF